MRDKFLVLQNIFIFNELLYGMSEGAKNLKIFTVFLRIQVRAANLADCREPLIPLLKGESREGLEIK